MDDEKRKRRELLDQHEKTLREAEESAVCQGIGYGIGASVITGLGLRLAEARGSKRLSPYASGVVICLSGLIVSQLMAHFLFLRVSDRVTFEKRRDATLRAEEKNRRMIDDWTNDQRRVKKGEMPSSSSSSSSL